MSGAACFPKVIMKNWWFLTGSDETNRNISERSLTLRVSQAEIWLAVHGSIYTDARECWLIFGLALFCARACKNIECYTQCCCKHWKCTIQKFINVMRHIKATLAWKRQGRTGHEIDEKVAELNSMMMEIVSKLWLPTEAFNTRSAEAPHPENVCKRKLGSSA